MVELQAVSGQIVNIPEQVQSLSVLLFDHTTSKITLFSLDKKNRFSIPISYFEPERSYSIHLVNEFLWIGDFSFTNLGSPIIKYTGGFGFDIGSLKFPENHFGKINPTKTKLIVPIGGGFSLDTDNRNFFEEFSDLRGLKYSAINANLNILNPLDIYSFFLNPDLDSEAIARSTAKFTTLSINILLSNPDRYREARVVNSDFYLKKALLVDSETIMTDIFWAHSDFQIPKSSDQFVQSFYTGIVPPIWNFAIVRIIPFEESTFYIPVVFRKNIDFPAYAIFTRDSEDQITTLDFSSKRSRNGLTAPICVNKNQKIGIKLPKTSSGFPDNFFSNLNVEFKFYAGNDQDLKEIEVKLQDFPEMLRSPLVISDIATWDPYEKNLKFQKLMPYNDIIEISLPYDTILKNIGEKKVAEIRLQLKFFQTKVGPTSKSVIRLAPSCTN